MHHVIVGAGPAGVIAAETLRQVDKECRITLIGAEDEPPYSRMAIPYFLVDEIGEDGTHLRRAPDHFESRRIDVVRNARVERVDTGARRIVLDGGDRVAYDRLLIASGARPAVPDVEGVEAPGVVSCWTLSDARRIRTLATEGCRAVLIGAGFIGSILLDALGSRQLSLTVIEAEDRMLPRMMNHVGAGLIKRWCEDKGVCVLTSTRVSRVEPGEEQLSLTLEGGQILPADLVITATGVVANTGFLDGSGIDLDEGVVVDEHLHSSVPGVYAAGDVAQGPDWSFSKPAVHAIQPTAVEHGRVAALNMAGRPTRYRGSLAMNVVETLGLTHYAFARWMGVQGGDGAEALDEAGFRYLRLEFDGDHLVGAIVIGPMEQAGVLRGLIQSRIDLGPWKARLLEDPWRVVDAYLACTDLGRKPPVLSVSA